VLVTEVDQRVSDKIRRVEAATPDPVDLDAKVVRTRRADSDTSGG
jgi:hypothetical protein